MCHLLFALMQKLPKLLMVALLTTLTGCAGMFYDGQRQGVSSSLVDYLYPEGKVPEGHSANMPVLKLPLTVGLAFVPSRGGNTLPEATKIALLEQVRERFVRREFVADIIVIPDTYLRSANGFNGVDQIARLYGLDAIALVSYDQVTVSEEKAGAFLYWTIVGAYTVPANQNITTTFVDTAVFDISSRKLLFRAPGTNEVERSSTLVGVAEKQRELRDKGFQGAMADMTTNLEAELERFRSRVKEGQVAQVEHRPGYSGGGGAIDGWWLLFGAGLLLLLRRWRSI